MMRFDSGELPRPRLRFSTLAPMLLGVLSLCVGCGSSDSVELADARTLPGPHGPARVGATSAQRFGGESMFQPPSTPASSPFRYDVPDGWKDVGAESMRVVNLAIGADTQCYVIVLGGDGGGLVANVNRWRKEVGLGPIGESEVAALEKIDLLGAASPLLEVSGDYQGMGGSAGADRTLLGAIAIRPQGSVFVKMVGPSAEVDANRQGFVDFVTSLEDAR